MAVIPDNETKEKAPRLTYDIHGRTDKSVVGEHGSFYLRNGEDQKLMREPERVASPEEIQMALQIAKQAAANARRVQQAMPAKIAEEAKPMTAIEVKAQRDVDVYKPRYPASVIIVAQPTPKDYRFWELEQVVAAHAGGESIYAQPSRLKAAHRLNQTLVENTQTGRTEPVFNSIIEVGDERENIPAKRRPRVPTRQSTLLSQWKSRSLIEKVRLARLAAAAAGKRK